MNSLFETKLRIMKAEKQHFGRYECRASNEFGSDQSFVDFIGMYNLIRDTHDPPFCFLQHLA